MTSYRLFLCLCLSVLSPFSSKNGSFFGVNSFVLLQCTTSQRCTYRQRGSQSSQQWQQYYQETQKNKDTSSSTLLFKRYATKINEDLVTDVSAANDYSIISNIDRRRFFRNSWLSTIVSGSIMTTIMIQPVEALVKGNAPPPKMSPSDRPKCTNIDECEAQAEQRERERLALQKQQAEVDNTSILTTSKGTRYIEYTSPTTSTQVAKINDEVSIYYKVLKLGKRSYDGLSGEGTVVFSKGYGYNDDEVKEKQQTFITTVGAYYNIDALNDILSYKMKIGTVRRFSILPDQGWRKPGKLCDGGPGGSGAGGELRTDYGKFSLSLETITSNLYRKRLSFELLIFNSYIYYSEFLFLFVSNFVYINIHSINHSGSTNSYYG